MKKNIVALFAVLGLSQTSKAQSHLDIKISGNLYVIVFTDGTSEEYPLGKQDVYSFYFDNDIDYLVYYETISPANATAKVQGERTTFAATFLESGIRDESRSFSSIIR